MTIFLWLLILWSIIATIVLAIIQLYNPNMRRLTSVLAILSSTLSILMLIGANTQDKENTKEIEDLVNAHYTFADNVLDYLTCMTDDTKTDCRPEVSLVMDHLEKLYPTD